MPAFGSGNFLNSDLSKERRHSAFTSTVQDSFIDAGVVAITSDNTPNAYGCDDSLDKHYKYAGFSGTIDNSFTAANNNLGITWDGGDKSTASTLRYYTADNANTKIKKFSGFVSTVADSIVRDSFWDVTFDEADLYGADFTGTTQLVRMSAFTTTVKNSFASPGASPRGISIQAANLLSTNAGTNPKEAAFEHSAFSSTIKSSFTTLSYHGSEWDDFTARTTFSAAGAASTSFRLLIMGVG